MNKFQIGDRVRVYGNYPTSSKDGLYGYVRGEIAVVTAISNEEEVIVKPLDTRFKEAEVHPKQCRLLKSKRRRVWVDPQGLERDNEYLTSTNCPMSCDNGDWIEFVEVKKPKS